MVEIGIVEIMMIQIVIGKKNGRLEMRVTLYLYSLRQDFLFPAPVSVTNLKYYRFNLS
jgi:hypothetical protein